MPQGETVSRIRARQLFQQHMYITRFSENNASICDIQRERCCCATVPGNRIQWLCAVEGWLQPQNVQVLSGQLWGALVSKTAIVALTNSDFCTFPKAPNEAARIVKNVQADGILESSKLHFMTVSV